MVQCIAFRLGFCFLSCYFQFVLEFASFKLQSGIVMVGPYLHFEKLEDSSHLSVLKMPWVGNAKTRRFVVIVPHVLELDLDVQLSVLVPNLVVGATKDYTSREKAFDTKRRLLLIGKLRLCCKAWKNIVDSSVEYHALRLAAHEFRMGPHALPELCLPREHNLVKLFKLNLMLFSQSRHVTSTISKRILRSELAELSLRNLARLRDELESCYGATEFYGMFFGSFYPYWTCPADRV